MAFSEYQPGTAFPGRIGRTTDESTPAWPQPVRAVPGSPNVLFIVLDDTGFGQLGCYGSPIATPHLDSLAAGGLRYNHMHTTALCSPSRSCVDHRPQPPRQRDGGDHRTGHRLSGLRRQHPVRERVPVRDAAAARLQHLHDRQMAPDAVGAGVRRRARTTGGRWGVASTASTASWAATPASGIPTWSTTTTRWSRRVARSEGYHLTEDLADHAISFIADAKQVAPDKPFFLHFCTGATHAPHHVAKEWADRYAGRFDEGWDAYRGRCSPGRRSWGSCPPTPSCRGTTPTSPSGSRSPRRAPARHPDDGGVRRASCPTPTPRSGGCWTSCARPASWTTR